VETGDSDELDAVADLIDRCYPHLQPSPETVAAWTHHPAFDADLWLWVWDRAADRPAGLGIAELDPTVGEGSLEWIQMLPDYRSRGLGRALVAALLARLGDAAFVTVGGEVHASGQPERFYRRCGFRGDDVWWVVRALERLNVLTLPGRGLGSAGTNLALEARFPTLVG
jgi:GNAT superfamily N-acetyltransferase